MQLIELHPTHNKNSKQSGNRIDLYDDFELYTDLGPTTVGEVLRNPRNTCTVVILMNLVMGVITTALP